MNITYELLLKMPDGYSACLEGLEWFTNEFGGDDNGVEWWQAFNACDNEQWIAWFVASYVAPDIREQLACLIAVKAIKMLSLETGKDYKGYENNLLPSQLGDCLSICENDISDTGYFIDNIIRNALYSNNNAYHIGNSVILLYSLERTIRGDALMVTRNLRQWVREAATAALEIHLGE